MPKKKKLKVDMLEVKPAKPEPHLDSDEMSDKKIVKEFLLKIWDTYSCPYLIIIYNDGIFKNRVCIAGGFSDCLSVSHPLNETFLALYPVKTESKDGDVYAGNPVHVPIGNIIRISVYETYEDILTATATAKLEQSINLHTMNHYVNYSTSVESGKITRELLKKWAENE